MTVEPLGVYRWLFINKGYIHASRYNKKRRAEMAVRKRDLFQPLIHYA